MTVENEHLEDETSKEVPEVVAVEEPIALPPEKTIEDVKPTPEEETEDAESKIKEVESEIRIFLHQVNLGAITLALEKRSEILGAEEFRARVDTIGSYENVLVEAASDYSLEAERILKSIEAIEDKSLFDNKLIREGKTILSSILKPRRLSSKGKSLSGREARIDFAIKSGQVKRISLLNSGFTIDIEAPTLGMLNAFFTKAHDETAKYGREFGAQFFYFNDLLIKEAIVELIMPLVMSTSLKNWNRGDALIRNIKLNDLKVILTTLGSMMFPDGFNFTHVCTNVGKCTHKEELLIDVAQLIRNNYMKLSNDNIDHMHRHTEVTQEKVDEYQESLGFKKLLRYENIEFELRVPSLSDHLVYGRKFNSDLLKTNFADNAGDIQQSLLFSYYQVYTPFIESVTLYDTNNEKDVMSSDPDVIAHQLARLQETDKDTKFVTDIDKFIDDTEITKISYPAAPCPKCNHLPEGKDYYSVDPEHTFFILVLKKLTKS